MGHIYQKGQQTCARVTNQTVYREIPVTDACNHHSTDVVDMWEAEVEQKPRGEKGVDELLRGIKGSLVTRESETQQENTAARQLKFTVPSTQSRILVGKAATELLSFFPSFCCCAS